VTPIFTGVQGRALAAHRTRSVSEGMAASTRLGPYHSRFGHNRIGCMLAHTRAHPVDLTAFTVCQLLLAQTIHFFLTNNPVNNILLSWLPLSR
jgi:hypothetical protein